MGDLLSGLRRFRVFRNGRCTPAPIALPQLDFLSDQLVDGRRFRIREFAPAQNASWKASMAGLRDELLAVKGFSDGGHEKCPLLAICDHRTVIV